MLNILRHLGARVSQRFEKPSIAAVRPPTAPANAPEDSGRTDSAPLQENAQPQPAEDTFCVLAWNHLQIAPNGTVKLCCIAGEDLRDKGRALNVYADGYDDIWNSEYMRSARQGMANGERISACARCYHEETVLGRSRRTTMNALWAPRQSEQASLVDMARQNDWKVKDAPTFLQLNMGNLCNLACRMCTSQYSSRIASDPVQSRWKPDASTDAARWRGDRLRIGPRPMAGIETVGFHAYEAGPDSGWRWTNGRGMIQFPLPDDARPLRLELDLAPAPLPDRTLRVVVNDTEMYCGELDQRRKLSLDIAQIGNQATVKIELLSASYQAPGRMLGVLLHDACLVAQRTGRSKANARVLTRYTENSGWWGQPKLMYEEILGQPDKLRYLILQGGEPLLIPETEDILDYLIERDCAGHVTLEIVSNMTTLKPSTLEKLRRFARVELGGSIDGIGETLEYIRYPAKWPEIEENLQRAKTVPSIRIQFNVAVQAYNLLDVPNLLSYCQRNGYEICVHFLVGPYYLSVLTMPLSVRDLAAARVRQLIAGGCSPAVRSAADTVLHHLDQHRTIERREMLRDFMLFTNDMDRSRGQSFQQAQGELHQHILDSGFEWTDELLHARGN